MFPVAYMHCILATKFARSFVFNDMCIKNHLSGKGKCNYRKRTSYKMIFRPEHDEDISYVYVVNQIFEVVSDLFAKQIWKRIGPYYL